MAQPVANDLLIWNGTKGVYGTPPPTDNRLLFIARKYNVDTATNIPAIPIAINNIYIGLPPAGEAVTFLNYSVTGKTIGSSPTLTGMDASSGVWTVPTSGYYYMEMIVSIWANNDPSDNAIETGDFGTGSMQFGIFTSAGGRYMFKKEVTVLGAGGVAGMSSTAVGRTGFINFIESRVCYITAGVALSYKVLNNTQLAYTPEPVGNQHQAVYWLVIKLD